MSASFSRAVLDCCSQCAASLPQEGERNFCAHWGSFLIRQRGPRAQDSPLSGSRGWPPDRPAGAFARSGARHAGPRYRCSNVRHKRGRGARSHSESGKRLGDRGGLLWRHRSEQDSHAHVDGSCGRRPLEGGSPVLLHGIGGHTGWAVPPICDHRPILPAGPPVVWALRAGWPVYGPEPGPADPPRRADQPDRKPDQ